MRISAERSLMAELAQEIAHYGMVIQFPQRQVRWQPLDLKRPRRRARRERPFEHRPERGGIALRPHAEPVVEIAFRPEVLRRDKDASARPECPPERNGPVGRVAIERDVHPGGSPEQWQPRRLLAPTP